MVAVVRLTEWESVVKRYVDRREGFANRRDFLCYLATGPDHRQDVQAARRLITKPRYK